MAVTRNTTPYDTTILHKLIRKVYKQLCKQENDEITNWSKLNLTIVNARKRTSKAKNGYYSGWVQVNNRIPHMWLRLVRSAKTRWVCALIEHELWHLFGYDHPDYDDDLMHEWDRLDSRYDWAVKITKSEFLPLTKKEQ